MSHLAPMSVVCHPGQKGLEEASEVAAGSVIVEIQIYCLFKVPSHDICYMIFSGCSKADRKEEADTGELLH